MLSNKLLTNKFIALISLSLVLSLSACLKSNTHSTLTKTKITLNSERIEQKFGSYGIEILNSDEVNRISNLYSTDLDGNKITRTLAIVRFSENPDAKLAREHQVIVNGGSLGAILKAHGWQIEKINQYLGEITVQPNMSRRLMTMMNLDNKINTKSNAATLAIHRYGLFASKDSDKIHYADITEIHHPDYLDITELQEIYQSPPISDTNSWLQQILRTLNQLM